MRKSFLWATLVAILTAAGARAVTVQNPANLVEGLPFLWVEAETATIAGPENWLLVDKTNPIQHPVSGLDILPADTDASGGAALFMRGNDFSSATGLEHATATMEVQFATAGNYRLYLRYSKYDGNAGTLDNSYANEDSIWVPPDFGLSALDGWIGFEGEGWPGATDPSGPAIPDVGDSVRDGWVPLTGSIVSAGVTELHNDAAGEPGFWDGKGFHWSYINIAEDISAPATFVDDFGQKIQYKVSEDRVGQVLTFEIVPRENYGVVDGLLFVKQDDDDTNLLQILSQEDLSAAVLPSAPVLTCDLNGDGRVDAADAGIMFGDWGGPGSTSAADKNGDGFVDAADAGVMFEQWTGDLAPAGSESASAEYNAGTGELRVNVNGAVNVFVNSAGGLITPLASSPSGVQGLLTNNKNRVGMTNLSPINVSDFSFGSIGANIPMADLSLVYSPRLGGQQVTVPFSGAAGAQAHYIPEPASFGLIGLGLAGLLAARRK